MPKPKKVDPLKAREKRAKIMVGVLLGVLVLVGAIMIPPVLKQGGPPPEAAAPPASTTVSLAPSAAPSTGATTPSTAAAPTTAGELADTDVPPASANGQLVSFSVFQAKNPFTPQVTETPASVPDGSGSTTGSTTPAPSGTDTTSTATTPTTTTPAPTGTTSVVPSTGGGDGTVTTTTPAPAPGVTIVVNGHAAQVAAQATFPTGSPVFRLVSFTSTSAQVGIVGGSYAAGGATLTLELGKPVTLENQTDGKRYTLELTKTH